MTDAPGRPWWKRKRWGAAGLLWLALSYPVSIGPAGYLSIWGVISYDTYNAIYRPLDLWFFNTPLSRFCRGEEYVTWWVRLAERHSGNRL